VPDGTMLWHAPADLFANIDTSMEGLKRLDRSHPRQLTDGLAAIAAAIREARTAAKTSASSAVAPLAAGRRAVRDLNAKLPALLPSSPPVVGSGPAQAYIFNTDVIYELSLRLSQKYEQFSAALAIAAGARLDALADDGVVTPGQTVNVSVYGAGTGELKSVALSGFDGQLSACAGDLSKAVACKASVKIPANTHLSTPYWTPRKDAARYDFEPDVPFGVPFRPTPFKAAFTLVIGGEEVTIERPVQFRYSNLVAGEKRTQLQVSPAFNVTVDPDIAVFPIAGGELPPEGGSHGNLPAKAGSHGNLPAKAGSHENPVASAFRRKTVQVTVGNNQKGAATASVALQAPAGWTVEPSSQPIKFSREDEAVTVTFAVQPPVSAAAGESTLKAVVTAENGARSDLGYEVVEYPHIHRRHVVQPADVRVKVMDVTVASGVKVGYVMGVGDKVPEAIQQLGAEVRMIDADMLASGDLSQFDVVMLGVRAYERRQDLRANNQRLLDYAAAGGTVVVQYQRTEFNEAQYGPYPAKTTADRVTDENAPIEILVPGHPLFTTPNRIGPDAWRGWVQERGTYFMGERDPRYVDLVRSQDPFPYNAGSKTGILVEARVGKGRWIYTGLGLWRQLPAGTDGAYRLLANLISLGKKAA